MVSTSLTDFEVICPHEMPCNTLPHAIQLSDPQLGYMRCRTFPAVFREHKFKEQKDPHQFYYNELLMYKHWRSEDEFSTTDVTQCLNILNILSNNNPQLTETQFVQQNTTELMFTNYLDQTTQTLTFLKLLQQHIIQLLVLTQHF